MGGVWPHRRESAKACFSLPPAIMQPNDAHPHPHNAHPLRSTLDSPTLPPLLLHSPSASSPRTRKQPHGRRGLGKRGRKQKAASHTKLPSPPHSSNRGVLCPPSGRRRRRRGRRGRRRRRRRSGRQREGPAASVCPPRHPPCLGAGEGIASPSSTRQQRPAGRVQHAAALEQRRRRRRRKRTHGRGPRGPRGQFARGGDAPEGRGREFAGAGL